MDEEQNWTWDGKRDVYPILEKEENCPIPFEDLPDWLFAEKNKARIQNHLTRYFTAEYSGKYFETLIFQSDPRIFTPWDILAVEALSVSVPTKTAKWLLEPDPARDGLLADVHRSLDLYLDSLWTCDEKLLHDGGALSDLYTLLRSQPGLGKVTASKLLAAKFPAVVPIRDSKVENLLELQNSDEWWGPMRRLFITPGQDLFDLFQRFELPDGYWFVSTLRKLDVTLWMEAKARKIQT
jgi:hypothetical protein